MTLPSSITVSAPGSLMVLGEHAVLQGHPCLVAAINRRIRATLTPRRDQIVCIRSALGTWQGRRHEVPGEKPPAFRFILAALERQPAAYPGGFDLTIDADMPATIGFGTSAAVTVAVLGTLTVEHSSTLCAAALMREARAVIRAVQGRGSGADVAASAGGGIVFYQQSDASPRITSTHPHPLTALYCGYKTPTPDVIAQVEKAWHDRPSALANLHARIADVAKKARDVLANHGDPGPSLDAGQALMEELGVSTPELAACVERLRQMPDITGAKISGSGLGDCAVGWGRLPPGTSDPGGYPSYDLTIDPGGVRLE